MNKNIRPNYFEDLIDEEMIRIVSGNDDDIFEYLSSLPQDEQRPAILSVLDKDIGLFEKIMSIMNGEYIPKVEHISNVVEMMRGYVKVGKTEKKKFGEVMTPVWLVEDMLDKLPEDVWSNPDLKWLDPANGCGVFPSVIVKRLMDGLAEWEPDPETRYKHIMENMIYACEIQAKNMFLYLCAHDPEDVYLLNIFHGSFLSEEFDEHMKNEWGVDNFDIIVGNPPYQEAARGKGRTKKIWHKFAHKCLSLLSHGGYCSLVHPPGWRNVSGHYKKVQNAIKEMDIIYLEMHSVEDGIKTFGATTPYDFYLVRNTKTDDLITEIKCKDGTEENRCLDNWEFIPGGMFDEIQNLLAKSEGEKVETVADSSYHTARCHTSKENSEEFKYPCIANVGDSTNKPTKIYWSNCNNRGHFGVSKVVFSRLGPGVYVDKGGEYGMTEDCRAIADHPSNLENIKKAMQSDKFQEIMKACKVGGLAGEVYNHKIIALFRRDFWQEFV